MKVDKKSMQLYVVTDRTWLNGNSLESQVEEIIKCGATFLQLREKNLDFDSFVKEGKKIKEITDRHNIPFVINDNVKVALAINADGAHVGQSDLSVKESRSLIGDNKILGVSAQTVEQAIKAQQEGADYIGVGAVFSTSTKSNAEDVSLQTLQAICEAVTIPVVAIGGINKDNIMKLKGSKVDGVAVISAIFASKNISKATKNLLDLSKEITK